MAYYPSSEDLTKSLVFRLHENTPEIVREVLLDREWIEYDGEEQEKGDWNLYWRTSGFTAVEYQNIMPWQRLNHHPKTMGITRKDNLARNLKRMSGVFGSASYNFSPVGFILPNDYTKFVAEYTKDKQANGGKAGYWICKPVDLSRGRGIFVFKDIEDLTYSCSVIVQKYISNPLLISGYKFDLRIYVCVTSFCPLTIYIYQEGLVRFGTEKFNLMNLDNVFSHLTNTSINKFGPSYTLDKERVGSGCKWTMSQFRSFLQGLNINELLLWQRISNIVTLTLLTVTSSIKPLPNCFELFGFDILIDDNIKPWLLEVNCSPALTIECTADVIVKKGLVYDLLDLLNYKDIDPLRYRGYPRPQDYNVFSSSSCPSFCVTNSYGNQSPLHPRTSKKGNATCSKEAWSSSQNHSLLLCRRSCNQSSVCNQSPTSEEQKVDTQKLEKENKNPTSCKPRLTFFQCTVSDDFGIIYKKVSALPAVQWAEKRTATNAKVPNSLPKNTLTSRLREKMNKGIGGENIPPKLKDLPKNRGTMVQNPKRQATKTIPRFPSVKVQKYKHTSFPQYSISEFDKKPLSRIGDFILTFPFNEATLKSSQSILDLKTVMQEMQKMLKRQLAQEHRSPKRKKSEATADITYSRKESIAPLLWGPRNPPLLSDCCYQV
ncbi:probable tubulin polyglutamylase TTLL2 [Callorhinchus milii]|uniref:probable tubulin polyglutamylase TTLL2 n=1 Tax=Callorhinchus milii TaxID=7868 RepID=UPI001C3F6830|nr:probable tubulin polyglutamylase TTLL2 [Callorhinchus milii]